MGKKKRRTSPRAARTKPVAARNVDGAAAALPPGPPPTRVARRCDAAAPRLLLICRCAVLALGVAVYLNTLGADFTFDDVPIVRDNELIRDLKNLPTMFRQNYWGLDETHEDKTLYRPLTIASYALDYALHGVHPAGYHAVNILLHGLVGLLLFEVVRCCFGCWRTAAAAAILFALHPVHTEAVAGIVGRAEILALLGSLICLWAYEHAVRETDGRLTPAVAGWLCLAVAAYLCAMLSKELGIIVPAAIIWWEALMPTRRRVLRGDRRALAAFAGFALVAVVFLALRAQAVTGKTMTMGYAGVPTAARLFTALRVCLEYVWLLLWPARLCAEYWVTEVPIARSAAEPGVLAAVLALTLAAMIGWRCRRRLPAVSWGLGVFAMYLFPVSNLPFAIGVMKAERLLYSPSAGFLVAVSALLQPLWSAARYRWLLAAAAVIVVPALTARTWRRNRDWHDNVTLAEVTLRQSPKSPAFNEILALQARREGRNEAARTYFRRSLEAKVNAVTLFNLGNVEMDLGHTTAAVGYYRRARKLDTDNADILNNLGLALLRLGRSGGAAKIFRRIIEIRPEHPGAYINLLSICAARGDTDVGVPAADEAVRRFPDVADVLYNAASVYTAAGRSAEARQLAARARAAEAKARP